MWFRLESRGHTRCWKAAPKTVCLKQKLRNLRHVKSDKVWYFRAYAADLKCETVQNVSPQEHRADFIGKRGQVQLEKVMNTLMGTWYLFFFFFSLCIFVQSSSSQSIIRVVKNTLPLDWVEPKRWILSWWIVHGGAPTLKWWSKKVKPTPEAASAAAYSQLRSLRDDFMNTNHFRSSIHDKRLPLVRDLFLFSFFNSAGAFN